MSADGARKLFVGGLSDSATEGDLRAVFEGAGFQVEQLALPRDRETGRLRGFAFITLTTEEEASRARSELHGVDCAGRPLSIREFSQDGPKRGTTERPPRQEDPTVFLGKLPFDATSQEISELFESKGVGPVVRLTLPMGPDGRPRGFGFATLASQDQVDRVVAALNGAQLKGRQIVVNPAQPRGAPAGPGGPRGGDGAPRRPLGGGPRFSDRPSGGGFSGGYDPYESQGPMEPPLFPPPEGRGERRRGADAKRDRKERKRGGGAGGETAGPAAAGRGGRRKRGGGGSWHQWESDDD